MNSPYTSPTRTRQTASWWNPGLLRAFSLSVIAALLHLGSSAQITITCNTTQNNGSAMATFNFTNTNADPIQITNISSWTSSAAANQATLWWKPTPITGNPTPVNAGNGWTAIGPQAFTVPAGSIQPMMSGIGLTIPAGATYGLVFSLTASLSYLNTTGSGITFNNGGCTVTMGTNVGWGGTLTSAINDRGFTGTISFIPLAACAGIPTAGTISGPPVICAGTGTTLSLSGSTLGGGITYTWKSSSTPGGPYTTVGTGFTFPTGNLASTTYYVCDVTCANSGQTSTTPEYTQNVSGPSAGGTFTIDNTLPTGGSNFNSFTHAITALNTLAQCGAFTGPVVFNVSAGQTFTEDAPPITASGDAVNGITFQRSGAGSNPLIVPTGSSANPSDAGIAIHGGDFITFDGIDINGSASSLLEFGYVVRNASATNGANNNTIQNCTITLTRVLTTTRGILQTGTTTGGGVIPTAASGANNNNIYRNFTIRNAYAGVNLNGGSTTFPDLNTQVTTTACNIFNSIGDPNVAADIGGGNSTVNTFGIQALNQSGVLISNNVISNVSNTTGQLDGITLASFIGTCTVSNNIIKAIRRSSTTSTVVLAGIRATHLTTGTNTLRIFNNAISDITTTYTGAAVATRTIKGIFLASTTGTSTQSYELWHNTVSLDGSASPNLSNACFETNNAITGPFIIARNNIFANYTPAQSGVARHYCVAHTVSNTQIGNTGTVFSHNDLYVANDVGASGFAAAGGATPSNFINAGNWAAGITGGQVLFNFDDNPILVNPVSNLAAQATALNGTGFAPPGYITNELGCGARGNDIGAYEFTPPSCFPPVGSVNYVQDCANSQFFLDVTVSSLSGGPGVDVVSDFAGNPGADFGVGLGTFQIGPFPSNTNVVVSLLRNGDATCNVNLGTYNFDCAINGQNALSFDGFNDGVNCGNAASLNILGTQITLEAWINPTVFKTDVFAGNIINKEGGNAGYQLRCGGSGVLEAALGIGTGYITVTSPANTLTLNTWQHVAVTYDGANARLYKNGVQVASIAGTAAITTSPNAMRIGDYAVTPGARNFAGRIDEARVWSVARTAGDIAAFQTQQLCGSEVGLAAYYKFDQGTAAGNNAGVTTLTDLTANANNGTLYSFALTGPSSNWVIGRTGMGACVACIGAPSAGTITGTASTCNAASNSLILSGATYGLGITYQWKYGPVGGPYTNSLGTVTSQNTSAIPIGAYEVVVEVTCSDGPSTTTTAPFALTVFGVPTASASAGPGCLGQTLNLTGTTDIGATFAWTGPNSFVSTAQNPSIPAVTAAATGTYSFIATANGCSSTPSTVAVVVNPSPTISSATATPGTVCVGETSQLNVVASSNLFYQVSSIPYAPQVGSGTGITVWNVGGSLTADDSHSQPITLPFSFNFNGTPTSQVWVGTNGYLALTNPSAWGSLEVRTSTNMNIATVPNGIIALSMADLNVVSPGTVQTFTTGSPGSQVFVVQYTNVPFFSATGAVSGQILLYEGTNIVEVHVTSVAHGTSTSANALGIENLAGTARVFAPGRSPAVWNVSIPEAWRFSPPSATYLWSPAGSLSNASITNPVATLTGTTTYTVTVSNGACSLNGTVTVNATVVDDGDPCTVDGCVSGVATHTYTDTDNDGTCDGLDGCPLDANKIAPGICGCGVSDADSDGDLTADCNDGCPADPNKIAPGICGCGTSDVDTDNDLTADCFDLCPTDPNKTDPGLCGCFNPEGTCDDCEGVPSGPAQPGTACDDLDACTINDVWSPVCVCFGTFQDTDGDSVCDADDICPGADDLLDTDGDGLVDCLDNCPLIGGQIGTGCDDGNPNTVGDIVDENCVCAGTVPTCPNNLTILSLTTDDDADQTTWDVIPQGGGPTLCSGVGLADNTTFGYNCCLPNGCYELRVFDSAGDGIANGSIGGYVLTQASGNKRIIDNSGDGLFTNLSQIPNNLGFCLPIGTDAVIATHCDKNDWQVNDVIQAATNPSVTAQFGVSNANSGYQFWFFNPDGGYSRRITQTHAAPGPVSGPPANIRSSYLKLSSLVTQPLPFYTNLNVRVRTEVAGVFSEFGAACRFRLDPPCTTTQLTPIPDPVASCGATGLTLTSTIYATTVPGATTYQFEFSKPGYNRRIAVGTRQVALSFVTSPLQNNNCYNVRIRVSMDGAQTYCPFGPYCSITIGTSLCPPPPGMATEPETDETMVQEARFDLWPNPNDGSEVNLSFAGFDAALTTVAVDVTDAYGKLVTSRTLAVQDGYLMTTLDFEQDLAPGLYLVNLQAGEERFTERLVIQR